MSNTVKMEICKICGRKIYVTIGLDEPSYKGVDCCSSECARTARLIEAITDLRRAVNDVANKLDGLVR